MTQFSHRRLLSTPQAGIQETISKVMARDITEFACGQLQATQQTIANATTSYVLEAIDDAFIISQSAPEETWTLTATSATNFTVVGSVSLATADATVALEYDNALIQFTIPTLTEGYTAGDTITLVATHGIRRLTLTSTFGGAGTGNIFDFIYKQSLNETFTLTALNATTFTVTGSVSGVMPNATVDTVYDNVFDASITQCSFLIDTGGVDFVAPFTFLLEGTYDVLPQADRWQVLVGTGGNTKSVDKRSTTKEFLANLKGPGSAGNGPVFARVNSLTTAGYDNMAVTRANDFVAGGLTGLDVEYVATPEFADTDALVRVTRRNIACAFNVGSEYGDQFYCGLLKPFLSPGAHPYPFYLATTGTALSINYPRTYSTDVSSGFGPGAYGKSIRDPGLADIGITSTNSMYPLRLGDTAFAPIDKVEVSYTGVGDGLVTEFRRENYATPRELITITATSATDFTVSGSVQGVLVNATADVDYYASGWLFTIRPGGVAFQSGDVFSISKVPREFLQPVELVAWGELEGVYVCSHDANCGDIIQVGGDNYFVTSDLQQTRTSENLEHRYALRMD